jgi:hypothetical protein
MPQIVQYGGTLFSKPVFGLKFSLRHFDDAGVSPFAQWLMIVFLS